MTVYLAEQETIVSKAMKITTLSMETTAMILLTEEKETIRFTAIAGTIP